MEGVGSSGFFFSSPYPQDLERPVPTSESQNFLLVFLQNKSTAIPNSHRARPVEYNCDKNQASLDGLSAFGFQPPLVPSVSTWKCGFYVEMQADPQ